MMLLQMPSSAGPTLGHCSGVPWLSSHTAGGLASTTATALGHGGVLALGFATGAGAGGGGRMSGLRSRTNQPPAPPAASVLARIRKSDRSMAMALLLPERRPS